MSPLGMCPLVVIDHKGSSGVNVSANRWALYGVVLKVKVECIKQAEPCLKVKVKCLS
jgi:hypothetical protein